MRPSFQPLAALLSAAIGALTLFASPAVARADFTFLNEDAMPGDTLGSDAPQGWLTSASADWMGRLPSSTSLAHVSLPGTHDSGARHGGAACETQVWSISQQLDAGIRYLDIRLRRTQDAFAVHHGPCFQEIMFGDVMNQVGAFLDAHPKETLLMRVKEETDAEGGSLTFPQIWARYMGRYGKYFAGSLSSIPTLGQVRGKVVVLRDVELGTTPGMGLWNNSKVYVQDFYKVFWMANDNPFGDDTVSLPQKKRKIRETITRATTSNQLTINHLSGAQGMIPRDVARATNADAYAFLGQAGGPQHVGVLVMDFPGDRLIYRIIKSNFAPQSGGSDTTWCGKTIRLKSWKGDYLHRPNTAQGVMTWPLPDGSEWKVVCEGGTVALRSWKGDYLHRSNEGLTTYSSGVGNQWTLERSGSQVTLKSWKGDYLHRPNTANGVTPWHAGDGNLWTVEVVR